MARPTLKKRERLSEKISVNIKPDVKKKLQKVAEEKGMDIPKLIRLELRKYLDADVK